MSTPLNNFVAGRTMSHGDPGVRLEFAFPLPPWGWALVTIACLSIALWCYWRISGSVLWRSFLAALRTATLLLLALLLAGPRLVRQPERTERDWVVFMADRSLSMTVADVGPDGARTTRDAQLRESLLASAMPLDKIASDRSTMWLGFDSGAFDLPAPAANLPPWPDPSGRRTDLSRPLEQALQRVAARPVSGIVVFSDGRFATPTSRAVLQKLAAEQIPVFVVPVGSAGEVSDIAVDRVDAPSRAFVDDIVPVNVRLTRSGGEKLPWNGTVQLVETSTGVVLDEQDLAQAAAGAQAAAQGLPQDNGPDLDLSLAARPPAPGKLSWTVRVVPRSPDLTENNNSKSVSVDLTDRPVRVVYFDGYPRWEYRYMRGLLVRERSIRSSTLLLSASRRYLQEGTEPLTSIPTSDGDWGAIDVVVIGDVRAELFSAEQLENLKNHVARDGAGLLWIAGPSATPGSWRDSPLADLLPFSMGRGGEGREPVVASALPVVLEPTASASRLGLLRLGESGRSDWPDTLSDPTSGWSRLWWTQRIEPDRLKPTAETLAIMTPQPGSEQSWPAVVTMRYGSGRIVYVATDETWRWRFGRGEALYERFWLPIIRLLARESLAASGQAALLEVAPDRPVVDQPVRVSLRLVDESIAGRLPQKLTVRVARPGASGSGDRSSELTLLPEGSRDGRTTSFATTWTPPDGGEFELSAVDAALGGVGADGGPPTARVEVVTADDERRTPQADHAALAALAQQTGGAVIQPDQLATLADKLPNRQVRVLGTPEIDPLWDRPGVYVAFMVLLTLEWIGRKWLRLA